MYNIRRKLLSQNFLYNQRLVSQLVGRSSVGKQDLVLEIGPGKGIITQVLVRQAGHVIGVEIDNDFVRQLQRMFSDTTNLTLYQEDFLSYALPSLPYKVFANIPFSIEGKIIRKLIDAPNPPQDCYLVVMKELADRLVAEKRENMFSVMHKPWFDFSIKYVFHPGDFSPVPDVIPVLFRFWMKKTPFLSFEERKTYQQFIQKAFGNGQSIRNNLKSTFPISTIDTALQKLSISKKTKPTQLSFTQWIKLYNMIKHEWY